MVSSDFLAGAAGVLLSLALSFIPGLAPWLARKDPTWKRLTVLIAVVLVAACAFGLSCAHVAGLPIQVECSSTGALGLAEAVVVCLMANQATDRITPNVGAGKTPEPGASTVTPATFFALMIVAFGALAGFLFLLASLRSKAFLSWRLLSLMTAAICLYCACLWGGALLLWWAVTPELGRPALCLALAALAWFGFLVPNASRKNAD